MQRNPSIPPSRRFIEALPAGTAYEAGTIVAESDIVDIVMVYGRYSGATPVPLIAVELFRFEGGTVVERWAVLQREVPGCGDERRQPHV